MSEISPLMKFRSTRSEYIDIFYPLFLFTFMRVYLFIYFHVFLVSTGIGLKIGWCTTFITTLALYLPLYCIYVLQKLSGGDQLSSRMYFNSIIIMYHTDNITQIAKYRSFSIKLSPSGCHENWDCSLRSSRFRFLSARKTREGIGQKGAKSRSGGEGRGRKGNACR